MPRFNKADRLELERARAVLKDPEATPDAQSNAKKLIERLQTERNRRVEARKAAGAQPQRKNFTTDADYKTALKEYWSKLDRAIAERECWKILNDPTSSTLVRTRAYERLGIEPPESLRRDEPLSDSPKENPQKPSLYRFSDSEIAEERRREQKFYDDISAMLVAEKGRKNSNERSNKPI
ncbi:MAG: hypothetical protein WA715_26855 [Candidatus Acidiferrum sp.]